MKQTPTATQVRNQIEKEEKTKAGAKMIKDYKKKSLKLKQAKVANDPHNTIFLNVSKDKAEMRARDYERENKKYWR
jgi:hypothetical protein